MVFEINFKKLRKELKLIKKSNLSLETKEGLLKRTTLVLDPIWRMIKALPLAAEEEENSDWLLIDALKRLETKVWKVSGNLIDPIIGNIIADSKYLEKLDSDLQEIEFQFRRLTEHIRHKNPEIFRRFCQYAIDEANKFI